MSSRRYRRRRPAPKPASGNLIGWALLTFAAVFLVVVMWGDRLPLPEKVTDGARQAATSVAPEVFPPTLQQAASEADFRCKVQRVNDGDTLRCQDGTRVRLHALAAREADNSCSPGHPCSTTSSAEATRALRQLVDRKTLDCMTTGQSFDRVTAICWTPEQIEVNCYMVENNKAELWERFDREVRICRHKRRLGSALR